MMTKWTETDQALFNTIARMRQPALVRSMAKYLRKYYAQEDVIVKKEYILAQGDIPVMLVAHMDTVFKSPPEKIYYDQKQHIMWSPQGLGADDRAGVYLIWRIVQAGYRPHICLTTDEEIGGLGADTLVKNFPEHPFDDLKYIIELDRQGMNDCVFYSCANEAFTSFVESYDFVTGWGTYSDISDICPVWEIAGVNLSVGYVGEHHETETLNTKAMLNTYRKVCIMLDEANSENTPHFEYIPDPYERYYMNLVRNYSGKNSWGWDFPGSDESSNSGYMSFYAKPQTPIKPECECAKCHRLYSKDDIFSVKDRKNVGTKYYCLDCASAGVNWCKKCGEAFEVDKETDELCPDCSGKRGIATE